jgi:hypothetical protein
MKTQKSSNGQAPRRQLSEQIDRLDLVIESLSENLNDAVATAVENAVGVAVQKAVEAVLLEVVSNPAVRELLRPQAPPTPPAPTPVDGSEGGKGTNGPCAAWAWMRTTARKAHDAAGRILRGTPGGIWSVVLAGAGMASGVWFLAQIIHQDVEL